MEICNGVDYLDQVKELIIEYTKRLGRDLSFQNIDEELKNIRDNHSNDALDLDSLQARQYQIKKL